MIDFIKNNFWHVSPIIGLAGIALAIMVERWRALVMTYPMSGASQFFEKVRDLIMADRIPEAIAFCERYRERLVPTVVREGLLRAHQPESLIEHGLEIAIADAAQKIQRRTGFLATIANVATLLGLLGTIVGLIQSFEAVGTAAAQERAALLANGISTAMNATMMGLGLAIPCMLAFSFLMNRANRLNADLDQSAIRTLDLLKQRYFSSEDSKKG
jgi:biopolymer transport protein ExbB/TolQ